MQVRVTLMGSLKPKRPPNGVVDIEEGASIDALLASLDIDPTQVQVILRNNKSQLDRSQQLSDGDQLTMIPPVGGG